MASTYCASPIRSGRGYPRRRIVTTKRIPYELREEMWDGIKGRVDKYLGGRVYASEIATTFNFIVSDELSMQRKATPIQKLSYFYVPFFGQYQVDPADPRQIRVLCHQGTEACSPIKIEQGGVIWRAILTGKHQLIEDVRKDPQHVTCDKIVEKYGATEIALLTLSEPNKSGPYKGRRVPMGVLDIDILGVNQVTLEEVKEKLLPLWRRVEKGVFPGEPEFQPPEGMFIAEPGQTKIIEFTTLDDILAA